MLLSLFTFLTIELVQARHFNGGTIRWAPVDPYTNSSSVAITITQSYAWTYPVITCAPNVPISTSGRSTQNTNLTCVTDCATDGGYSTKPIDILTDCQSFSSSLGMMSSERSKNITLAADAHFYLAFVGSAWIALNDPAQSGLQWSIVTFIDLRKRPDGFINTPPVAQVVSPQYAIVNRTIQIQIPVSDANAGDTVRCRWSTYTPGYRRRREAAIAQQSMESHDYYVYHEPREPSRFRNVRKAGACGPHSCSHGDDCSDNDCQGTTCTGATCAHFPCCYDVTTTAPIITSRTTSTSTSSTTTTSSTSTRTTTSVITTTTASTTTSTTTLETPGTLKSTSSYPHRQAIDECGGICYPNSLPNGTTLSACTITFTGPKINTWYGVAVQVMLYHTFF